MAMPQKKWNGTNAAIVLLMAAALGMSLWPGKESGSESALRSGLLAALLLLPLAFSLFSRKKKARSFAGGVSGSRLSAVPATRFSDVAANEEAMESLRDLVGFIRSPEKYSRMGARIPRGVLLYGMPGTGKTLMARALAGEAGVPFFAVNGADFVEMYVGVGASRVRELFRQARKAGRAVIFFDEIDAIGKKRNTQEGERDQTLNALLSEMDGFHGGGGVVVLAATNRVDTLDEALLRAGRFDRQIEVPMPGPTERERILTAHARNKPLAADVSLRELAARTTLFSGAKLEGVLNEAAIYAAKRDGAEISKEDVERAVDAMLVGAERRESETDLRERELTAAHEAGHALVTALLLPENSIRKVSVIPTARGAAGYSLSIPPEKLFHNRQELLNHIAVALAGREAEALLLGGDGVTTGASSDIEKAVALCRRMVCEWGMMPGGDEVWLFSQPQQDAAQQQWLNRGQQLAAGLLRRYAAPWRSLTEALLRRETLDGAEVLACLQEGEMASDIMSKM